MSGGFQVVQFIHPGFEYPARTHAGSAGGQSGVMAWKAGLSKHNRKFLLSIGSTRVLRLHNGHLPGRPPAHARQLAPCRSAERGLQDLDLNRSADGPTQPRVAGQERQVKLLNELDEQRVVPPVRPRALGSGRILAFLR